MEDACIVQMMPQSIVSSDFDEMQFVSNTCMENYKAPVFVFELPRKFGIDHDITRPFSSYIQNLRGGFISRTMPFKFKKLWKPPTVIIFSKCIPRSEFVVGFDKWVIWTVFRKDSGTRVNITCMRTTSPSFSPSSAK